MVMEKIESVQEYTAMITQEILDRYDGVVRVWDTPRSAIDGGQVVDQISQPTEIVVTDEEARTHYLAGAHVRPRTLPDSMLDDGELASLPILQRHQIAVSLFWGIQIACMT